jgi:hypothetical protein
MSDRKCYHGRGSYGKILSRTINSKGSSESKRSVSDYTRRFDTDRTDKISSDFKASPKKYAYQVGTFSEIDHDNLRTVYDEQVRGEYPCTTCHETELKDDEIMQLW